jgi:hypothetical protein
VLVLVTGAAFAQQPAEKLISYSTTQKSVQYVVIDLAAKVGLQYDWDKSYAQTDPECRQFLDNVSIQDQSFDQAMAKVLSPVGLRYLVEDGKVVLYRVQRAAKLINYSTDKKSVQYVVIDLAKQVGLGYDWDKSFAQTDPVCRRFVNHLSITDQSFDMAMAKVLDPVGLRYKVEDAKVVLYPR